MTSLFQRALLVAAGVLTLLVALVIVRNSSAEAPAPPKVSSFAPVADLQTAIGALVERVEDDLESEAGFDESKRGSVQKDASTLAVLALTLGQSDADSPQKKSAAALVTNAQALAVAKDFPAAKKALADFKAAFKDGSPSDVAQVKRPIAPLSQLMKEVPVINAGLKRGLSRFKTQAAATGGQSAALAAIAQAAMFDPPPGIDPQELAAWYQYCAEMRDASAAVNTAIHVGDEQQATAAMNRLTKSCETCHSKFRKKEQ